MGRVRRTDAEVQRSTRVCPDRAAPPAHRASSGPLRLEVTGPKPPGRGGAMLIDDPARGRVILFGGKTSGGALADLWELSLS